MTELNNIELRAHAKLNLSLKITGLLENGYHTLESVMVPLDLHDKVRDRSFTVIGYAHGKEFLERGRHFSSAMKIPDTIDNSDLTHRAAAIKIVFLSHQMFQRLVRDKSLALPQAKVA